MTKRITINDLAIMMKRGFDEMGKRFSGLEQKFGGLEQKFSGLEQKFEGLEQRFDALEYGNKTFKEEILGRMDKHEQKIEKLTHEVLQNGDALAKFIVRFEDESAANLTAHERMERKADARFDRIEQRLGLTPFLFPAN